MKHNAAEISRELARLSPQRRSALQALLIKEGLDVSKLPIPAYGDGSGAFPLSSAQQRIWYFSQIVSESPFYNMPSAVRYRGRLRADVLEKCLAEVIRRHQILCCRFESQHDEPRQIVEPQLQWHLPMVDLSSLQEVRRQREARRTSAWMARQPLDLARAPVWRFVLFRIQEEQHVLLMVIHHLVVDGWSMGVIQREMTALYEAFAKRDPSPLDELPIQYTDYALWQRDLLQGGSLERQLDYWKKRLADAPPKLSLPADRPRPARPLFRGAAHSFSLSRSASALLSQLSQHQKCTLYMTLLSAYKALIQRYTRMQDIIVGTPIANRNRSEVENLVGIFINTLALRSELSGDPTLLELLQRVRRTTLDAYQNQDIPFDWVIREMKLERQPGEVPLVQVMFQLQNAPGQPARSKSLEMSRFEVDFDKVNADLVLTMNESRSGLAGMAEYSVDLFDASTIVRFFRHFCALLEDWPKHPGKRLSETTFLSRAEGHQLLSGWNDSDGQPSLSGCFQHLFAQGWQEAADRIAVASDGHQLSFAELERRSGWLAGRLRQKGVGPEVVVGLMMQRSVHLATAILGIFKAGGAYLPLDPAYPAQRLNFMMEDAQSPLLLSESSLQERLPQSQAEILMADDLQPGEGGQAIAGVLPDKPAYEPSSLAYVIYTSGSTGKPKGVMMPHQGLTHYLDWCLKSYPLEEGWGSLVQSSISFDLTITALLYPLLCQRRVELIPEEGVEALAQAWAERGRIGLVKLTPAHLEALAQVLPEGFRPRSSSLVIGGEQLRGQALDAWRSRSDAERIFNEYGPTEAAVGCCVFEAPPAGVKRGAVPIGRPISNIRLYIVDRHFNPVPIGVSGELLIAGQGLARGYLRRPASSARSWIPDQLGSIAGQRLYRSGDLARFLADGSIEFAGRIDRQAKIRGFRLEPGEVESLLSQHPELQEAVVTVRRNSSDESILAAYLVIRPGGGENGSSAGPSNEDLRDFLKASLPEYMLPSAFIRLEELPLTVNGKLDHAALPDPEQAGAAASVAFVEPRSQAEKTVAAIWQEVLQTDRIGIHDNFFDVGGHSLRMLQVLRRLLKICNRKLSATELFQHPTVATMAQLLSPEQEQPSLKDEPSAEAPQPQPEPDQPAETEQPVGQPASVQPAEAAAGKGQRDIAVIGLAGRYPGARNLDEFWSNLVEGVETISFFDREELLAAGVSPAALDDPSYVPAAGVLDGIEDFDPAFFGMSPAEAAILDPQQRIFLEVAWETLESAGYAPSAFEGRIGVFAGLARSTYYQNNVLSNPQAVALLGGYQTYLCNEKDFLPTRVSYKLNLRGPSLNVQSGCSTSLAAIHLACRSLHSGECEMALAGGVTIQVPQRVGYRYEEGGIRSPDGHCRAFDAQARGTVFGNGAGAVLLKRLEDALADGDFIHAVVKGSALNNDGSFKVGFTAPSVQGQSKVICDALEAAGVEPRSIGLIEAHGTGTELGDPIEVAALDKVFRPASLRQASCALGSLKSNVGHLDAAAGVAGFSKAVLALRHQVIPPSLHFTQANPEIDFESSPFFVPRQTQQWKANGSVRRAGVSSFGIGGTNAHVIVEEVPQAAESEQDPNPQLLLLSAQSQQALDEATERLARHLSAQPTQKLSDVAFTLQVGRRAMSHRRFLVSSDRQEAVQALESRSGKRMQDGVQQFEGRPVAFLFPGQGAQHAGMGVQLQRSEKIFSRHLDRCAEILQPRLGLDLRDELRAEGEQARLDETWLTQPSLFAVEYALAQLWMSWGVRPEAMLGHSIGEYVAACLAGVFSLEQALELVAARGRLMHAQPRGAMLAVSLPVQRLEALLGDELCLAAVNEPSQCVASGPLEAVEALQRQLSEEGTACRLLRTSHAFHSAMMDPVLDEFEALVSKALPQPPRIPFISNLSGQWISEFEAADPAYWAGQMRSTVQFSQGLGELMKDAGRILLEVGPGRSLSAVASRRPGKPAQIEAVHSLDFPKPGHSEATCLLEAAGRLWLAGTEIDWNGLQQGNRRCRVPLPTYPFQRQRCWIERQAPAKPQARPSRPADETPAKESGALMIPSTASSHPQDVSQSAPPEQAQTDGETRQEAAESSPQPASSARLQRIQSLLTKLLASMLGVEPEKVDPQVSFIELGLDSLLLMQVSQTLKSNLGVKVPFRQLMEEFSTIERLTAKLDQELPADEEEEPPAAQAQPEEAPPAPEAPAAEAPAQAAPAEEPDEQPRPTSSGSAAASSLERIMSQQLQVMAEQLQILRGNGTASEVAQSAESLLQEAKATVSGQQKPNGRPAPSAAKQEPAPADSGKRDFKPEAYIPYQPIQAKAAGLDDGQRRHLNDLIKRLDQRLAGSKRITQQSRRPLADNRASAGFRTLWKELLYPLVVERAEGARVWDIDGNEYVDITMGYGTLLFGHSPDFLIDALREQARSGLQIGWQSPLAGKAAQMVCELTGVDRAAFVNSGTEAVMTSLRLARTATARDRFVMFKGSYHGFHDEALVSTTKTPAGDLISMPMAPGVSSHVSDAVTVLEYCSNEALEYLKAHAGDLAAILVEPQQSRRPGGFDSQSFLRELRKVADESGATLIFDEVITGFRMHPGGAQALYGVQADLVTYGKAAGAGVPIGIVAGKAEFMDAIDGGYWQFGDSSYPRAETTYLAGTFFKHPLTMAPIHAVLKHLKEQGPAMQEGLDRRTQELTARLDEYFRQESLPMRMMHSGSLYRFVFSNQVRYPDLFFYHLLENGVYVWEGRTLYMSTAHTDEDLERVVQAVKASAEAMREGGFLPSFSPKGGTGKPSEQGPDPSSQAGPPRPTEAQKELWTLAQLSEDASRAYNESSLIRLRGPFQVESMQQAVQKVVDRHEAVRASFGPLGEELRIAPQMKIEVPFDDLSQLDEKSRQEQYKCLLESEAQQTFDFAQGPLMRVRIIRLDEEDHTFVLTVHHIVTDGFSNGVLLREMAAHYSAACQGKQCRLADPTPFRQFVQWQADQQQGEEARDAEEFWMGQLKPLPPPLELPADRPRPSFMTFAGDRHKMVIEGDAYTSLKKLGAPVNATLFITLLAGVGALLHRLSGQSDLVLGAASAGHVAMGGKSLVGYCVNLVPLRSRAGANPSFSQHLSNVRGSMLDCIEHQNYPFNKLVKKLGMPVDPSRSPLLSVVLNLDQGEPDPSIFLGLRAEYGYNAPKASKFEIYLDIQALKDRIEFHWDYNTDLFDRSTIQRWADHLATLFESAAQDPSLPLSDLPLLSPRQRRQMLDCWHGPQADFEPASLQRMLEDQASRTPDDDALLFKEYRLTYHELNRRANQLARHLRQLGAGPEDRVAIFLDRSLEMVVSLLAVLKSGAGYLPLDPAYPAARLETMLGDSGARLLVTRQRLAERLSVTGVSTVSLDALRREINLHSGSNLEESASAHNLAYLIYTSGSTGKPKGVEVSRGALCNFVQAMHQEPGISPQDTLLAVTTLSFDISALEIFLPLTAGARLALAEAEAVADAVKLQQLLETRRVSLMQATPATWRLMLAGGWPKGGDLKILCGGEALPRDLADQLQQRCSQLWNMYGPTEATVWSNLERIDSEQGPVLIGPPIANYESWLLDAYLQPVLPGAIGALYLAGSGLARGYRNRPSATAAAFTPHPFSDSGGRRLYRTGDLARWLPEGKFEVLGRTDHQVKVRGARIELGDIEAALSGHPAIAQGAVTARPEEDGNQRLVAYAVARPGKSVDSDTLRTYLAERLPGYMIPALFIALDSLPLTPNGKVDRAALPAPDQSRPQMARQFVPPLTPGERDLAAIWSKVLQIDRIGVNDNFFELGGDSIRAVQIVARANQSGFALEPWHIFQHQTIAGLAEVAGAPAPQKRAEEAPSEGPLPMTPVQRWFLGLDLADAHHWNQAVLLEVQPGVRPAWLDRAAAALVEHHDALRLRFPQGEQGRQAEVAPVGDDLPLLRLDLSALPEAARDQARQGASSWVQASLDLAGGPLVRFAHFLTDQGKVSRLLIAVHHLAVDVTSWRILLQDLQNACLQAERGEALRLPPKTSSFKRWAERLQDYAQSNQAGQELELWRSMGRRPVNPLPRDLGQGFGSFASERTVSANLSPDETRWLLREAGKAYKAQPSEMLLAALAQALKEWSGSSQLLVSLESHGREDLFEDVDPSRTVGWFTSLYPLLLDLEEAEGPEQALRTVKQSFRAVPNGGIGYGVLRYLGGHTELPEAPEVSFDYYGGAVSAARASSEGGSQASQTKPKAPLRRIAESCGALRSPRGQRPFLLEASGQIQGEQMRLAIRYSSQAHRRSTIEGLVGAALKTLRQLIERGESPRTEAYAPSDFPAAGLDQEKLDQLIGKLK